MTAKYLDKILLMALTALLFLPQAHAWTTVYVSQWPTAPSGTIYSKNVTFPDGGKMKLEVWRQEIEGRPILFMQAGATEGSPLLCGVNFKVEQNGKKYSITLRGKGASFYDSYCGKAAQPIIVLIDQSPSEANFDDKAAFRLITDYLGPVDYLDVGSYSASSGASQATSSSDADRIFNWIESALPAYFSNATPTQIYQNYLYRHYGNTGLFLIIYNARVIVHDGKTYNMMDVGSVKDFLALAAASLPASGSVTVGNYICYAGVAANSYQRMGNVEILSGSTFRIADSAPYQYSYEASTGKITWQDSMFMGMASEFSTRDGKPQIHILYKTNELLYALDYYCSPE